LAAVVAVEKKLYQREGVDPQVTWRADSRRAARGDEGAGSEGGRMNIRTSVEVFSIVIESPSSL
jgi:hypothetical protein